MSILTRLAAAYGRLTPTNRGAYALARAARSTIPRDRWRSSFTTPQGLRLDLDLGTYPDCNMALGLYETETERLLRRLLRPGMHFVDCGANLGYFTLIAARLVGPTGRVDAFEPDPVNRARLDAHVAANAAANVRVHPAAVSDAPADLEFHHPTAGANHGQASRYAALVPVADRYTVRAVRLDDAVTGAPDVIKLDVEGAELDALRGATRLLAGDRPPALIIEHNHETARAAGYAPSDIFRHLTNIQPRYTFHQITWRLRTIPTPESLDALHRQDNILVTAR